MKQLNPAERRALRARAHALDPVVMVSGAGLTDTVLGEIERCLEAHELIKIRVFGDDRLQREALLGQICESTGGAPVQHIGKILVVYRGNPEPPAPTPTPATRLKSKGKAKGKAKSPPGRQPGAGPRNKTLHAQARQWSPPRPTSRPASRPASRPTARRKP